MIIYRDQAYKLLCSIRTPQQGGTDEVGTGMFVIKDKKTYIVTASHVVKTANSSTYLIVSDAQGNSIRHPISFFCAQNQWRHHPDADLAAIDVVINSNNNALLQSRFLPYDHIDTQTPSPSRDIELTSIGFPLGLGSAGLFSPLSFRTYASSGLNTFNRADNQMPCNFFCLENPSIGGYSGGPVFDLGYMIVGLMTQHKDKTICYGFMHGTLSDNTGGKLAVVTPATYLDGWL